MDTHERFEAANDDYLKFDLNREQTEPAARFTRMVVVR
jgi:hypothetical protein